jgi:hypothetical protein
MLYHLIDFGSTIFYGILILDFIVLILLDSGHRVGLTAGSLIALGLLSNVQIPSFEQGFWPGIQFLGIGLATFVVMYSINIRLIKRDLKAYEISHSVTPTEMGKMLSGSRYDNLGDFKRLHYRYHNEPSWPSFFDRVFCWPTAIPNFILGDFLRSFSTSAVKWLVQRRKEVIGYEVTKDHFD